MSLSAATWVALHLAISTANPSLSKEQVRELSRAEVKAAQHYQIAPLLLASLITEESRWRPGVENGSHVGLGQIALSNYPKAQRAAVRRHLLDPAWNLHESARWLAEWRKLCGGRTESYVGGYQGSGCSPSAATPKIIARWADLEIAAGWRRLDKREITPVMVAHANRILSSKRPLGSVVRFSVKGTRYAGLIELHGPQPHRGVSLLCSSGKKKERR